MYSFTLDVVLLVKLLLIIINSIGCVQSNMEANSTLCNFFDSINITGGIHNTDNSITFKNIRYTKENYGTFNYTYLQNKLKVAVAPHVRGWISNYERYIRLCCPYGQSRYKVIDGNLSKNITICVHNRDLNSISVEILDGEEKKTIDLMHNCNITLVSENPCKSGYYLDPGVHAPDKWNLLSNGSIITGEGNEESVLNHDEYCMEHVYENDTREFLVKPWICVDKDKLQLQPNQMIYDWIYLGFMFFVCLSIVFLLLTLFVYIWIEELRRTVHGKNVMCYIATLIVCYSFLVVSYSPLCYGATKRIIVSEIIHTAFISGFIWLTIISFNIWTSIGRMDNHRNQFKTNYLLACGLTFIIVSITNLLDHISWLPTRFRPGLGTKTCWLQGRNAYMLYMYSVIIIVITINTVLFILTKLKIEKLKRILDVAINCEGSRKFQCEETGDHFRLFLRLFVIMGLTWIVEIISFFINAQHFITYILDVLTIMLQGPVIFFLFILKKSVKNLIKQKHTAALKYWNNKISTK